MSLVHVTTEAPSPLLPSDEMVAQYLGPDELKIALGIQRIIGGSLWHVVSTPGSSKPMLDVSTFAAQFPHFNPIHSEPISKDDKAHIIGNINHGSSPAESSSRRPDVQTPVDSEMTPPSDEHHSHSQGDPWYESQAGTHPTNQTIDNEQRGNEEEGNAGKSEQQENSQDDQDSDDPGDLDDSDDSADSEDSEDKDDSDGFQLQDVVDSMLARKPMNKIPKPRGAASRNFNLRNKMGLRQEKTWYQDVLNSVHLWAGKYLDLRFSIMKQDKNHVILMEQAILQDHPELEQFQALWPITALVQQYLKNTSEMHRASDRTRAVRLEREPTFGKMKTKKDKNAAPPEDSGRAIAAPSKKANTKGKSTKKSKGKASPTDNAESPRAEAGPASSAPLQVPVTSKGNKRGPKSSKIKETHVSKGDKLSKPKPRPLQTKATPPQASTSSSLSTTTSSKKRPSTENDGPEYSAKKYKKVPNIPQPASSSREKSANVKKKKTC